MLCWFLPCSNTSQLHLYLYPLLLKPPFSPTPPHTSRSSQSTKRNSLFHTAASRQLFILHTVVITKRNTLTPVRMASTENIYKGGFPGGSPVKNPPAIAADLSSSLVWEDPTCHGANEACSPQLLYSLGAAATEPMCPGGHALQQEKPAQ